MTNVPPGRKLVPIEPTASMLDALIMPLGEGRQRSFCEVYREMVAASPEPPVEAE